MSSGMGRGDQTHDQAPSLGEVAGGGVGSASGSRLDEPGASSHCCGPGTWLQVLETIGVLAVIANGMVIAFTSEFIPRVVYKYHYGPCRQGARPAVE